MNKQIWTLAWRNIWRNKRRAFITMASIAVSLFFVLLLRQMQFWVYDFNVRNSISAQIGYMQITDQAYVDEAILDYSISKNQVPISEIENISGVSEVIPRFSSGALTSIGLKSKFAGVLGIYPDIDNSSLKLDRKLSEGSLLSEGDRAIMITNKMADYYQVGVGDSLVMIGMGYQGYTAAGIYPVKGIIDIPSGNMANMVYMPMIEAQQMYAAPGLFTQFLINISDKDELNEVKSEVGELLESSSLTVRTWEEVLPGLKEGLEVDALGGMFMAGILYMIVGFGIFGTIVMMYNERQFEFGVLSAIGMSKLKMIQVTFAELFMLIAMGILAGITLVYPICMYYNANPILLGGEAAEGAISKGFDPYLGLGLYMDVFAGNAFAIASISLIASLYMIVKLVGLEPLKAMRR